MKKRLLTIATFFLAAIVCSVSSCKKDDTKQNIVTYSKVNLQVIYLESYLPKDSLGNNWDYDFEGTYPDIAFDLDSYSWPLTKVGTYKVENASLPKIIYEVPQYNDFFDFVPTSTFRMTFYDRDIPYYTYMGYVDCDFSKYTTGTNAYPKQILLTNGQFSVKLGVTWYN
jgi:hypothetical protein